MPGFRVCVIGAGVNGLATCYHLLADYPGIYDVTVIADAFSPNTTSDVAFGLWLPYFLQNTPREKIKKWSVDTLEHVAKLARSEEGPKAGFFFLSGYSLYKHKAKADEWSADAIEYRQLTNNEIKMMFPAYKFGFTWTTVTAECKYYLPYLMKKISTLGGKFQKRRISSLSEVYGRFDVIVNCTGIRAKQLTGDVELEPIKGQVVRVRAPWVKTFAFDLEEEVSYILPGRDFVVIGGVAEKGNWNTDASPSSRHRMLEQAYKMIPSLKNAEVLEDGVGLRPGRTSVRVEAETVQYNDAGREKTQMIVHNYGQGGAGIGLHWGCAREAAQLVLRAIQPNHKL